MLPSHLQFLHMAGCGRSMWSLFGNTPLRCYTFPTNVSKQGAIWVKTCWRREKVGLLVLETRPGLKDARHFPVCRSKVCSEKWGNFGAFPLGTVGIQGTELKCGGKIKECALKQFISDVHTIIQDTTEKTWPVSKTYSLKGGLACTFLQHLWSNWATVKLLSTPMERDWNELSPCSVMFNGFAL